MDNKRTGELIAESRKAQGLTQKQLAEKLHISDRTVSKWERGAGFPDVGMLEPLADILGLSVISILQGEQEQVSEASIRQAIAKVYTQAKTITWKKLSTIIASLLVLAFAGWWIYMMMNYSGFLPLHKNIAMEIPITVYVDGEPVENSLVTIEGERYKHSFSGTFAIDYVERTTKPDIQAVITWGEAWKKVFGEPAYNDIISFYVYGSPLDCGIKRNIYISQDMTRFALELEDGTVIATDEHLVPLIMLDEYYPLDI